MSHCQGAPGYDGEDPWTLPWLVSLHRMIFNIVLSLTCCHQDVPANEDKIFPSGQARVGRAQLCGKICQRELQIAQGATILMGYSSPRTFSSLPNVLGELMS